MLPAGKLPFIHTFSRSIWEGRKRAYSLSIAAQILSCLREGAVSVRFFADKASTRPFTVCRGYGVLSSREIAHSGSQAETRASPPYRCPFPSLHSVLLSPLGAGGLGLCPGECVRRIAGRDACPTQGWENAPSQPSHNLRTTAFCPHCGEKFFDIYPALFSTACFCGNSGVTL